MTRKPSAKLGLTMPKSFKTAAFQQVMQNRMDGGPGKSSGGLAMIDRWRDVRCWPWRTRQFASLHLPSSAGRRLQMYGPGS